MPPPTHESFLLANKFSELRTLALPHASGEELVDLERTFYAGAFTVHTELRRALQSSASAEELIARLDAMFHEIVTFYRESCPEQKDALQLIQACYDMFKICPPAVD